MFQLKVLKFKGFKIKKLNNSIKIQNSKFKIINMNDSKAFTLIETVVAIGLSTLVLGAVFGFVYYFYRTSGYNLSQIGAVNSARKGMETMVREIREATYSDEGAYSIKQAQNQSFTFYSDIDKDLNVERVRYFLEDNSLKKGVLKASGDPPQYQEENEEVRILSHDVRNGDEAVFKYYDKDNNLVADLERYTDIRLIEIKLVVNTDPNRPPGEFTLISNAQFRNLKEE